MEENFCLCSNEESRMFPFLEIKQENNLFRRVYEDYFIDRLKPLLELAL